MRYIIKTTPNGTCYIYDTEKKASVLKSVTPQAKYNSELAAVVCEALNKLTKPLINSGE